MIYSWLSIIYGLSRGGPTKVKAGKSFLFTEGSLKAENKEHFILFLLLLFFLYTKKKEHFIDFVATLYFILGAVHILRNTILNNFRPPPHPSITHLCPKAYVLT